MNKMYKLFCLKNGQLYPLYVEANKPLPRGCWLPAVMPPINACTKTGKPQIKSKIGNLAFRPGWHGAVLPYAPHIGGGAKECRNLVWVECFYSNTINYQPVVEQIGRNKKGKLIPANACLTDRVPVNGYYRYRTSHRCKVDWLITGSLFINRILTSDEVDRILAKAEVI